MSLLYGAQQFVGEFAADGYALTAIQNLGWDAYGTGLGPAQNGSQYQKTGDGLIYTYSLSGWSAGGGSSTQTNAGNPTGVLTPTAAGSICVDTSNDIVYIANGATNTDWKAITN